MTNEKTSIRLALVKVGVAVALSFAGFFYSHFTIRRNFSSVLPELPENEDGTEAKQSKGSSDCCTARNTKENVSATRVSNDRCVGNNKDENDMALHTPEKGFDGDGDFKNTVPECDKHKIEQEIIQLKILIKDLREREQKLEVQKLEFYALKEQQATISELQSHLKQIDKESKVLALKVESLQEDNRRLETQVADQQNVIAELGTARETIIALTKKMNDEAKQNREHVQTLREKVSSMLEQDHLSAWYGSGSQDDLESIKDLEDEAERVRAANSNLQQENDELAQQLDLAQTLAHSIPVNPKTQELRELGVRLRNEREELVKRLERLRTGSASDAEELAHQRRVHERLESELLKFEPKSGFRTKQLSLQEVDQTETTSIDLESCASGSTESVDSDLSYRSSKTSGSRRSKILNKLRALVGGRKDNSVHNHSPYHVVAGDVDFAPPSSRRVSTSSLLNSRLGLPPLSTRGSAVIPRADSRRTDYLKDPRASRRNSDVGSSLQTRKAPPLGDFPIRRSSEQEARDIEKAELIKFAKFLNDRNKKTGENTKTRKSQS